MFVSTLALPAGPLTPAWYVFDGSVVLLVDVEEDVLLEVDVVREVDVVLEVEVDVVREVDVVLETEVDVVDAGSVVVVSGVHPQVVVMSSWGLPVGASMELYLTEFVDAVSMAKQRTPLCTASVTSNCTTWFCVTGASNDARTSGS